MFDRIVLVGAGKSSSSIVERLARIAPVMVLDTSAAALEAIALRAQDETVHPVDMRVADGTSRLVLSDVRGGAALGVALVLAPGDDRAALESCRLGVELEFKPVIAIVNDADIADRCEKLGARALVRAELVGQLVEQSLVQGGLGVSSAVGFGRGDTVEFRVMPSSPAINVPLAKLHADSWRVAAIYRGKQLVLPTGATRIEADDRVLLVGDPVQLPHVAESLRVGVPTFPLLHGPNVVVYLPQGRDGLVETEAEVLTARTRADRLVRVFPYANAARKVIDTPAPDGTVRRKLFEEAPLEGGSLGAHVATLRAKQPGVVVTKARLRDPADVILGRGGQEAVLCNEVGVPVLFPRGSSHHERVVLCVTDGENDLGAAEVALDLARMFTVPLVVLRVKLPTYLQPAEAATEKLIETITQRARLHGRKAHVQELEGNPISEWVRASTPSDLAVIARRRTVRDSFSKPDLALRVARKSRGSVLVVTVGS